MRLSITILLLLLGFIAKSNLPSCQLHENFELVKVASKKKKLSLLITTKFVETHEVKKGVQGTTAHILNSIPKVSFASKETRNFLDSFFISYFSYFTSYKYLVEHNHYAGHIAIDKKLAIVYPFHSFW